MSDKILRALMQLFAIIANTDEVGLQGRDIVERFLRRQLGSNLVGHYLSVYDQFLENLKGKTEEGKTRKRTSVNSVKVLRICTEINRELEQKQKIIVLIRLLEFAHTATASLTEQHVEFIKTVADTFTIHEQDYDNCFRLISNFSAPEVINNRQFLTISKLESAVVSGRHIQREALSGGITFLRINDPQLFIFIYRGQDQLVLDGRSIIPNAVHVFEPGSVIRGPKMNAVYYNDIIHNFLEFNIAQTITFKVEELGYVFKGNKIGLHDLSFSAASKNLVGIMGNSGAGKTTLLNLLNGSAKPSKGKILINGIELYSNKDKLHGLIGNIPQDDLLIEELSVFQNLFFSSKLYFGGLTDEQIEKKVESCLQSLGLYEIRNLLVGDPLNKFISGGQRKRLNIALELIREPEILFVDEPTSGLSSNDAENVMDLLKQLTLTGKLIFVVIHQPSSEIFKLFDELLLLDTGGYPIYYGNPVDSVQYFKRQMHYVDYENSECPECGNINPEEIFRIIEAKTVDEFGRATSQRKIPTQEWFKLYNTHFVNKAALDKSEAGAGANETLKVAGRLSQFIVYFKRNLFAKLNNRQYMAITLFEGPVLALILGFALRSHEIGKPYQFGKNPNIPVYMFICTIVALFLGLIVSADEIIQDKKILKRESFLQLSRGSYLLSKVAFLFLVSAVQSLLFLTIGNSILGFKGLFFDYWLVLFSVSCFANLLGLNISSGLRTRVAVYILIPFLVIPQIMLSGVMVKFEDLCPEMSNQSKVPLIGNIMASRWAFEALATDQFKNNAHEKAFFELERQHSDGEYITDYWVPEMHKQSGVLGQLLTRKDPPADSIQYMGNLLQGELTFVHNANPDKQIAFASIPALSASNYLQTCEKNIDSIERFFVRLKNSASAQKQDVLVRMSKKMGIDEFQKYRDSYYNSQLEDMVLNNNLKDKEIVAGNRIIRKFAPIYISASGTGLLSAPFYAHSKSFFGVQMETVWFNVLIIWLMAAVLYMVLYFDLLRKLLER
jgi:ABC-type multidrug transport system ATPase subunit